MVRPVFLCHKYSENPPPTSYPTSVGHISIRLSSFSWPYYWYVAESFWLRLQLALSLIVHSDNIFCATMARGELSRLFIAVLREERRSQAEEEERRRQAEEEERRSQAEEEPHAEEDEVPAEVSQEEASQTDQEEDRQVEKGDTEPNAAWYQEALARKIAIGDLPPIPQWGSRFPHEHWILVGQWLKDKRRSQAEEEPHAEEDEVPAEVSQEEASQTDQEEDRQVEKGDTEPNAAWYLKALEHKIAIGDLPPIPQWGSGWTMVEGQKKVLHNFEQNNQTVDAEPFKQEPVKGAD